MSRMEHLLKGGLHRPCQCLDLLPSLSAPQLSKSWPRLGTVPVLCQAGVSWPSGLGRLLKGALPNALPGQSRSMLHDLRPVKQTGHMAPWWRQWRRGKKNPAETLEELTQALASLHLGSSPYPITSSPSALVSGSTQYAQTNIC